MNDDDVRGTEPVRLGIVSQHRGFSVEEATTTEAGRIRGIILDTIAVRVGQVPDLHPRLLEGIEVAARRLAPEPEEPHVPSDLDLVTIAHSVENRAWFVRRGHRGYPQTVLSEGNLSVIAEVFEGPEHTEHPPMIAAYISTFDPPTVLGLLQRAVAAEQLLDDVRDHPAVTAVEADGTVTINVAAVQERDEARITHYRQRTHAAEQAAEEAAASLEALRTVLRSWDGTPEGVKTALDLTIDADRIMTKALAAGDGDGTFILSTEEADIVRRAGVRP